MISHPALDGPFSVPTAWGPQTINGVVYQVATALQAYASPVPAGVPVLACEDCIALTFTDEQTAQAVLPDYWSPDE